MSITENEKNLLFVTEGSKFEPAIIKRLFDVLLSEDGKSGKVNSDIPKHVQSVLRFDYPRNDYHIFVMKLIKNRLKELMKLIFSDSDYTAETLFSLSGNQDPDDFYMKFFCFDVDYAEYPVLQNMIERLQDPYNEGLLLLSSPCIEALGDFHLSDFLLPKGEHLSMTYKRIVKKNTSELNLSRNGNRTMQEIVSDNLFSCISMNYNKAKRRWKNIDRFDDSRSFLSEFIGSENSNENGFYYPTIISLFYLSAYSLFVDDGLNDDEVEKKFHSLALLEPLYNEILDCLNKTSMSNMTI